MPRWTPDARRKQGEQIRKTQPWRHATGPRTAAGKAVVARNALRHGFRNAQMREFLFLLAEQKRWVAGLDRREAKANLLIFFTRAAAPEKIPANKMNKPCPVKTLPFANRSPDNGHPMTAENITSKRFHVFNAFSDKAFGGNPAGVVLDADGLRDDQMQAIARQLNLVETVFAFPRPVPGIDYRLRYFTPEKELPIAGHPTVAAWACLAHAGKVKVPANGEVSFRQETKAGLIDVLFRDGKIFVSQKTPTIRIEDISWPELCSVFGIDVEDIDTKHPLAVVDAGLGHLIFCTRSQSALMKMRFQPEILRALCQKAGAAECQIFTLEALSDGHTGQTRNLCPRYGLEDPACGNGNAALGAYMLEFVTPVDSGFFSFRQGEIVNMPSVIDILASRHGTTMIGGHARLMQEGVIYL